MSVGTSEQYRYNNLVFVPYIRTTYLVPRYLMSKREPTVTVT